MPFARYMHSPFRNACTLGQVFLITSMDCLAGPASSLLVPVLNEALSSLARQMQLACRSASSSHKHDESSTYYPLCKFSNALPMLR